MMAIWKLIFSSRELGPNNTAISSRYRAHVGRIRFKIYRVGRLSMEICGRRGTKFRWAEGNLLCWAMFPNVKNYLVSYFSFFFLWQISAIYYASTAIPRRWPQKILRHPALLCIQWCSGWWTSILHQLGSNSGCLSSSQLVSVSSSWQGLLLLGQEAEEERSCRI